MRCSLEGANEYASTIKPFLNDFLRANNAVPVSEWQVIVSSTTPRQSNGSDCGLCTCINADILSRTGRVEDLRYTVDNDFAANQSKRIGVELLFGQLLTDVCN